ncbi:MAG: hypothetical protein IH968_16675, partial [Gemmatimonadetes bacterium]|nr:hypothetical protein [Gemmatimonadota bacterium]
GLLVASGASRPARIRAALTTSLGFGGANACVALAPATEGRATGGDGFLLPGPPGHSQRVNQDAQPKADAPPCGGQAPELPRDFARGESREVRYLRWALREALALDYTPRFELWMLWSGDVVSVA